MTDELNEATLMKATEGPNGVKIYNLSVGKTLPEWLSEKKRRSLAKDEDYRRRIEIIQDFHFNTASQRIRMTRDQAYIIATGEYKPCVKIFDVAEMSLKTERYLDSEIVQFEVLSDDYSKLAFMCADRKVEFHAKFGKYYSTRIPKFGRDMQYHGPSCDLFFGASGNDIYRLNLERGQFLVRHTPLLGGPLGMRLDLDAS